MTMTINGSGTITGLSAGGLPSATINQTNLNTNVAGNGPAFSYYQSSAQTPSAATATKITFTSSEFDTTSGMYASSRFTPTVAGYYQINAGVTIAAAVNVMIVYVYKNGSSYKQANSSSSLVSSQQLGVLVYCNGSTDYIEIYSYIGVSQALNTNPFATYFQGALVRAA